MQHWTVLPISFPKAPKLISTETKSKSKSKSRARRVMFTNAYLQSE